MQHDDKVKAECVLNYFGHLNASYGELRHIRQQMDRIRESVGLAAVRTREGVKGGEDKDKLAEALSRMEELEEEWAEAMESHMSEVSEALKCCTATRESECVWMHYMDGVPWGGVAQAMGYTPGHVRGKVRTRGISHIYARMPDEWRRSLPNAI